MQLKRTPLEALEAVLTIAFGGVAARMASHFGVSDQTVSWWRKGERAGKAVKFPADHCPECERLTNGAVRCEELRPDVAWDVLRMQAADCKCCHDDPGT
jgi:DNA-binding transcriptional regulator YdaS (Cro superfamily)